VLTLFSGKRYSRCRRSKVHTVPVPVMPILL